MFAWKKKTKKLRKRPFWWNTLQQLQWKKYLLTATVISLVIAWLFGGNRIYTSTLWSPAYTMTKIVFAPESVNALSSIELYTSIVTQLTDKNYYRTKRFFKNNILRTLQQDHPLISDITLQHTEPWTVYVTITFLQPRVLRQTPSAYFASYDERLYKIPAQSILMSGLTAIQLPKFSSGRDSIDGIYRAIPEKELVTYVDQIRTALSGDTISELIYQPWGKRLFVTYKGKRVYFNLQKDLLIQIEKLLALEQHRAWFTNVRTIDVGSRDEVVAE